MKIFLAGNDTGMMLMMKAAITSFHKPSLFSYHYFSQCSKEDQQLAIRYFNHFDAEILCDSGLFTYMFGSAKGEKKPLEFWMDYAKRYIETAHSWGIKNLTIVECDTHKLLGMDATWRLRELFKSCGLPVLYVWHREESLDGLISLADAKDFIALSVPELRVLFKGNETRYQAAVQDLCGRIQRQAKKIPKIHLLGNTVEELMKMHLPYSCDSTSWTSGGRFGNAKVFTYQTLKTVENKSKDFQDFKAHYLSQHTECDRLMREHVVLKRDGRTPEYMVDYAVCAYAYHLYQEFLDRTFQWQGNR